MVERPDQEGGECRQDLACFGVDQHQERVLGTGVRALFCQEILIRDLIIYDQTLETSHGAWLRN